MPMVSAAVEQRWAENKAAGVVRRAIQKVRLAKPDNFEELQSEVYDAQQQEGENLGDLHDKVSEEIERGLDVARRRVLLIEERREKDMAKFEKVIEQMQELKSAVEEFEHKCVQFKSANVPDEESGLSLEEVEDVDSLITEFETDATTFRKVCGEFFQKNQKEMTSPSLSSELQQEWRGVSKKIKDCIQDAQVSVVKAKEAVKKTRERAKKEKMVELKEQWKAQVQQVNVAVEEAEQSVSEVEKLAQPFGPTAKPSAEVDLPVLAEETEQGIASAKEKVAAARSLLDSTTDGLDEKFKQDFKAFMMVEAKSAISKVGLMVRRLERTTQLLSRYHAKVKDAKVTEQVKELKDELFAKIEGAAGAAPLEEAEQLVKDAEKKVEPLSKRKGVSTKDLLASCDVADATVEEAKSALSQARQEIVPIDESLDEDVKKKLHELISPKIKKRELLLGQLDRRLVRAANIVSTCRKDLEKLKSQQADKFRSLFLQVVRHNYRANDFTKDAFYDVFDAAGSGSIDKDSFVKGAEASLDFAKESKMAPEKDLAELDSACIEDLFGVLFHGANATKEAFIQVLFPDMEVVKTTSLTSGLAIAKSTTLRQMKMGELLEVIEGPVKEGSAGVQRVRVKARSDGKEGWATVSSNAGTVFLAEHKPK